MRTLNLRTENTSPQSVFSLFSCTVRHVICCRSTFEVWMPFSVALLLASSLFPPQLLLDPVLVLDIVLREALSVGLAPRQFLLQLSVCCFTISCFVRASFSFDAWLISWCISASWLRCCSSTVSRSRVSSFLALVSAMSRSSFESNPTKDRFWGSSGSRTGAFGRHQLCRAGRVDCGSRAEAREIGRAQERPRSIC